MSAKKGLLAKKLKQERIKVEEEKLADATDTEERIFREGKIKQLQENLQESHFKVPKLNFEGLSPLSMSMGDFEGDEDDDSSEYTKEIEEEVGNVGSELIKPVLQQKPKKERGNLNIDVASIVKRAFSSKKTLF